MKKEFNSEASWKVGLDLGAVNTVYRETRTSPGKQGEPRGISFPTVIGYPRGMSGKDAVAGAFIGREALARFEALELEYPLREKGRDRFLLLSDFIHRFHRTMAATRKGKPWGVVAHPPGADRERLREIRGAVNELFERVVLVEEPLLIAAALFEECRSRCAVLVDLGATSTRVYLVSGSAPLDDERFVVSGGGDGVDCRLKEHLFDRYPDLVLSDETVRHAKERLGFVEPMGRPCVLELMLGDVKRPLEITEEMRGACEPLVGEVLDGVERVLSPCPSDYVDHFLDNIFLLGGGTKMRGLAERVQLELVARGLENAVVRAVRDAESLVADGAMRWSLSLADEEWGIPLFSFQG